jgi:hypothetical protein
MCCSLKVVAKREWYVRTVLSVKVVADLSPGFLELLDLGCVCFSLQLYNP